MSGSAEKKSGTETINVVPELDPIARRALEQVVGASDKFQTLPAVAQTDPATIAGAQLLQDRPESEFIGAGAQSLLDTLSGRFLGAGSDELGAVEDRIISAAQRGVGDQFSLAGRTGSPAQQISLAQTIARELAPFQFGQFQNERQNQLGALSLAPQFEPLLNSQAQRLLGVGDIVQGQNQLAIDEPFLQFERFANPLLSAAGRFPVSTSQTGKTNQTTLKAGFSL